MSDKDRGKMVVLVDGYGQFELPPITVYDTVVLQNHKELIWDKIDFETLAEKYPHVTWIVEDNAFLKRAENHHNWPFYFLHHVIWHATRMHWGDDLSGTLASNEQNFGPRRFCFMNNIARSYRVKLWDRLESDGHINEYCSFLHRGKAVGDINKRFDWLKHGHDFSMRPPTFYDSVIADMYCETSVKGDMRFTEKTWKPLFYGKIPLGFGPKHYYKTLTDLGFKFPDYLNYSFDDIDNAAERFEGFYEQIKRFILKPETPNIYAEHNRKRCCELSQEHPEPPDVLAELWWKAEEIIRLGRFLEPEEREEYWHPNK